MRTLALDFALCEGLKGVQKVQAGTELRHVPIGHAANFSYGGDVRPRSATPQVEIADGDERPIGLCGAACLFL